MAKIIRALSCAVWAALAVTAGAVESGAVVDRSSQLSAFGNLPLYFEANHGQTDDHFQFIARGHGCNFFVAPAEALLTLTKFDASSGGREERGATRTVRTAQTRSLRFQFMGANRQARMSGVGELPGRANYFLGNNPSRWRAGIPLFTQTRVEQIYPGVDLIYYGNQQRLEYDFVVAARANPQVISIHFTGADKIHVDARGDLVFALGRDEIRQPKPVIYQLVHGARKEITGGYRLVDRQTVAFQISDYDHELPLVIDPVLSYSRYFGGSGLETGWGVQVDTNGFVYVAGETMGAIPVNPGTATNKFAGSTAFHGDAFVAKFGNNATNLIYLSYVGGRNDDVALSLAVDGAGNAYITGYTDSTNFPTFPPNSAIFTNISGVPFPDTGLPPIDGFVTKLGPLGTNLVYSTFLGGIGLDEGVGIAIDPAGNAYVGGYTESINFPTKNTPWTNYFTGGDVFVAKIGPAGTNLVYSTFLGGARQDVGNDIAADAGGNAYVTGYTRSRDFPIFNAVQDLLNNVTNAFTNVIYDAFVTKLTPGEGVPVALAYSTYLGGTNSDYGIRLDVDSSANAFVVGATFSPDFFRSSTNLASAVAGAGANTYPPDDVFVVKLDASGARTYSVVFGGAGSDEGWDVAADSAGNAHLVGLTTSLDFPTSHTAGSLSGNNSGGADVFVAELNSNGTGLVYSAYLGGSGADYGYGITLDPAGNSYIVGQTASGNFPTLPAGQTTRSGTKDAFLAKILVEPTLSEVASGENVVLSWPAFAPEFKLQSNTSVVSSNSWVDVATPPVLVDGRHTVTLGATNAALVFRLRKP